MRSNLRLLVAATLVIFLPGCSSGKAFRPGDTDFPVSVGLAPGQTISVTDPRDSLVVSAIEESLFVTFSWAEKDPVLRMNGRQAWPGVPEPPPLPPDSASLVPYLSIPFIRDLAGENPDYERLLAAYQAYWEARERLSRDIWRLYASRVPHSPSNEAELASANEVAHACCELASESELVESCEAWTDGMDLHWKGTARTTWLILVPGDQWVDTPPPAATSVSRALALDVVKAVVIALRSWNPVHIELGQGRFGVSPKKGDAR
jgi:hypothetical protein